MEVQFVGKSNSTGELVYGWYIREARALINGAPAICLSQAEIVSYIIYSEDGQLHIHEVDPSTVGQYIGVKDKNDKKIYVGSKLQHEDGTISVVECDLPHFILRHSDGSSDFIAKNNVFVLVE